MDGPTSAARCSAKHLCSSCGRGAHSQVNRFIFDAVSYFDSQEGTPPEAASPSPEKRALDQKMEWSSIKLVLSSTCPCCKKPHKNGQRCPNLGSACLSCGGGGHNKSQCKDKFKIPRGFACYKCWDVIGGDIGDHKCDFTLKEFLIAARHQVDSHSEHSVWWKKIWSTKTARFKVATEYFQALVQEPKKTK